MLDGYARRGNAGLRSDFCTVHTWLPRMAGKCEVPQQHDYTLQGAYTKIMITCGWRHVEHDVWLRTKKIKSAKS